METNPESSRIVIRKMGKSRQESWSGSNASLFAEARGWDQVHSLIPSLLNFWHVLPAAEHWLFSITIYVHTQMDHVAKAQDGPWDRSCHTVTCEAD